MTNDSQHDKEEEVELPEGVEKRLQLEKGEEAQARKRKDVKQNIDTQSCPGSSEILPITSGRSLLIRHIVYFPDPCCNDSKRS